MALTKCLVAKYPNILAEYQKPVEAPAAVPAVNFLTLASQRSAVGPGFLGLVCLLVLYV